MNAVWVFLPRAEEWCPCPAHCGRIVGKQEVIRFLPVCPSSDHQPERHRESLRRRSLPRKVDDATIESSNTTDLLRRRCLELEWCKCQSFKTCDLPLAYFPHCSQRGGAESGAESPLVH